MNETDIDTDAALEPLGDAANEPIADSAIEPTVEDDYWQETVALEDISLDDLPDLGDLPDEEPVDLNNR